MDLNALAGGVARALLPAARQHRIGLGTDLPDRPVHVQGLEWLLREALANLLDNAIRYTPRAGEATGAGVFREGNVAWLAVEDSGEHIARGYLARSRRALPAQTRRAKTGRARAVAWPSSTPSVGIHGGQLVLENIGGKRGRACARHWCLP